MVNICSGQLERVGRFGYAVVDHLARRWKPEPCGTLHCNSHSHAGYRRPSEMGLEWVSVVACNSLDSRLLDADGRDTSAIYRCGPFLFSHQIVFHAIIDFLYFLLEILLMGFSENFPMGVP